MNTKHASEFIFGLASLALMGFVLGHMIYVNQVERPVIEVIAPISDDVSQSTSTVTVPPETDDELAEPNSPVVTPIIDQDEVVMCTADAMQCPDGSWVGRTGPNCEFVCPNPSPAEQPVACTEEAKICPDGSVVVRTGPHCEFAPCSQAEDATLEVR